MMVDVLKEINNSNAYSKTTLARKLNTDETVIEDIMKRLKKMGYIEEENLNKSCSRMCKTCSKNCFGKPINIISVTDKGKKLIEHNSI